MIYLVIGLVVIVVVLAGAALSLFAHGSRRPGAVSGGAGAGAEAPGPSDPEA